MGVLSQQHLQVRPDDFLNPAHSPKLHEIIGSKALLFAVELESFDSRIETNLVSIFETVGNCFLRAVYADWDAVYFVCFDPETEGLP